MSPSRALRSLLAVRFGCLMVFYLLFSVLMSVDLCVPLSALPRTVESAVNTSRCGAGVEDICGSSCISPPCLC